MARKTNRLEIWEIQSTNITIDPDMTTCKICGRILPKKYYEKKRICKMCRGE